VSVFLETIIVFDENSFAQIKLYYPTKIEIVQASSRQTGLVYFGSFWLEFEMNTCP
jgi:hypothetical protein